MARIELSNIGGGGGTTLSLTTTGTSGASTLAGSVLNIPVYQGQLTLTTTGTSGAATLSGDVLNIPQYSGGGTPAGSAGQVQFNSTPAGSFAASANLTWDDMATQLNIGAPSAPTGKINAKGGGSSSSTVNLRLTNSGNTELFKVLDDGSTNIGTGFNWDNVNGRLGIGINAPTTQLEIKGNNDASFKMSGGTAGRFFSIKYFNSPAACEFEADNIFRVKIGSNYPLYIAGSGIVLINGISPNASAQFQIDSATRGFLPPRMSTTQKTGIASPAQGLVVYDTTMQALSAYNGSNWATVGGGEQMFTITGSTATINFNAGNIADITLATSTTLTLTGGTFGTFVIKLTQDATGGRTVTWPATVKWSGGTPPSLTTTGGKTDIVYLVFDGATYFGTYALNF